MRVSFTQFWRSATDLNIYPGSRKERRKMARMDWPKYKKGRQHGEVIDADAVQSFVDKQLAADKAG